MVACAAAACIVFMSPPVFFSIPDGDPQVLSSARASETGP